MPFFDDAPLLVATKSKDQKTTSKLPVRSIPLVVPPSKIESQLVVGSMRIGFPSAPVTADPGGGTSVGGKIRLELPHDIGKGKVVDIRSRRIEACTLLARRIIRR